MPESMIDRVARAIAKVPRGYGMTIAESDEYARAAIEAMRTMSDPMMFVMEDSLAYGEDLTVAWDKVIDAALNEQVAE